MRGFVISGTGSGVGKTSVTTGIMHALSKKMEVQGFKVGPDFIDPMYHTVATGRRSRNLDTFMMSKDVMKGLAHYASKGANMTIVEGVRGLYEGSSGLDEVGSTAEIAKTLGLPVVLVLNARSLTRSAAAILQGFKSFDKDVNIAGVILNQVSNDQHERKLRDAISSNTDVRIIGSIRRNTDVSVSERYLGLDTISAGKKETLLNMEGMLSDVDLDILEEIACEVEGEVRSPYVKRDVGLKAAVPLDDAFCFYFKENIECMTASGVKVEYFSPINGDPLPDADIYYIGGGYPELHLDRLTENGDFLQGLKSESENGKVIIGECGGLMTMCSTIVSERGDEYAGAGIFDARAEMAGIRCGPMYMTSDPTSDNPLFRHTIRGHEFHYSKVVPGKDPTFGYNVRRGIGISDKMDGLVHKNSIGTYMHQHALSVQDWMECICERVE